MFIRPLVKTIADAMKKRLPVFQVLTGPRQVGKTTIAQQVMEVLSFPAVYATADSPLPPGPEWIETNWRLAQVEFERHKKPVILVLDEIQKVRGWSETLKYHWDEGRRSKYDIRLLVLGSSALLLQEGLTESLAGRFYLNRCMHWSFQECNEAFGWDLRKWLYYGGYPGAVVFVKDEQQWKKYVLDSLIETVMARDVLQMQKITKPALMRHLFALSATFPAQIFSYNKMLGQLQDAGNTTTLAHYLKLLESAFLVSGVEVYSKGQIRKRGSSPKLILWNNALINAISSKTFRDAVGDPIWWGRLVENAVGLHLCNWLSGTEYSITYWREGDKEIDFIVTRGAESWAIEVKSGRSGKLSGIEYFRRKYPEAKVLIVGAGGIPLEQFFMSKADVWFMKE
ncbi:MAG: ATP-binding protein [Nitrospirae bacterium]|nr:ATP-binding protein [Nitrospirota bacterium]